MTEPSPAAVPSPPAWSPFKIGVFRALWLATLTSNTGTWMHEISAGWLMTSLTPSPVMKIERRLIVVGTSFNW